MMPSRTITFNYFCFAFGFLFLTGTLLSLSELPEKIRRSFYLSKEGVTISGVISRIEESSSQGRTRSKHQSLVGKTTYYHPVASFIVGERNYEVVLDDAWIDHQQPLYSEGQTVSIRYVPSDPEMATLDSSWLIWKDSLKYIALLIVGCFISLTGLLAPSKQCIAERPLFIFPLMGFIISILIFFMMGCVSFLANQNIALKIIGMFGVGFSVFLLQLTRKLWKLCRASD